ncbi:MAG TPA: ATP-binding protein [Myxococcales bacterium]|nr:ATP-binding protein [Myxococcales bacterium]
MLALVGVVPAALLGSLSFSVNRAELEHTVGSAQARVAEEAARACERFVAQAAESLRLSASVLPIHELSGAELATVLRIPYRQLDFLDALWLPGGPVVFESGNGRPAPDLEMLQREAPLRLAAHAGVAIGAPYAALDGTMRLPIALRLEGERILAAELSLAQLTRQMRQTSQSGTVAYLATREGRLLAQAEPFQLSPDERALLTASPSTQLVQRQDGQRWLAAASPVGSLGWLVVVAQREALALRPAVLVRQYTLFWVAVSLVLVLVLGAFLSRRVTEPMKRLREGVQALRLGRAVSAEVDSDDEIGELARSFNQMAAEIVRRDEEIRRWNAELQQRVDERTAELKTVQDQVLRARRLAALGSLGAGMAHELNNPVTAISGVAALLRKELTGTPQEESLRILQEQARRVSTIVGNLRAFADQERTHPGRRFPLHSSVLAALDLYEEQMRTHGIALSTDIKRCEAQGDPAQIQEAIAHIVQNAISAMPSGGTLKVTLGDVNGDALKLSVSDSGKGIPEGMRDRIFDPFFTTKDGAGAVGLGLSISHSIVEAHHGKLMVDSAEGHGATFTIVLPAAAAAAHLR